MVTTRFNGIPTAAPPVSGSVHRCRYCGMQVVGMDLHQGAARFGGRLTAVVRPDEDGLLLIGTRTFSTRGWPGFML
jgi:hypothetical protein